MGGGCRASLVVLPDQFPGTHSQFGVGVVVSRAVTDRALFGVHALRGDYPFKESRRFAMT